MAHMMAGDWLLVTDGCIHDQAGGYLAGNGRCFAIFFCGREGGV